MAGRREEDAHGGEDARAARLFPDQGEQLVALGLHVRLGDQALEAEAQQRLGVRQPDVEVPVVVVDRQAVELRDRGAGVARADRRDPPGGVRDLRVDLARDEVARAVRLEQLGERAAAPAEQLEDQQRGQRARVRGVEVGEVVVAGDLAAETPPSSRMRSLKKAWPTRLTSGTPPAARTVSATAREARTS